jgi:hypothetical protein
VRLGAALIAGASAIAAVAILLSAQFLAWQSTLPTNRGYGGIGVFLGALLLGLLGTTLVPCSVGITEWKREQLGSLLLCIGYSPAFVWLVGYGTVLIGTSLRIAP